MACLTSLEGHGSNEVTYGLRIHTTTQCSAVQVLSSSTKMAAEHGHSEVTEELISHGVERDQPIAEPPGNW